MSVSVANVSSGFLWRSSAQLVRRFECKHYYGLSRDWVPRTNVDYSHPRKEIRSTVVGPQTILFGFEFDMTGFGWELRPEYRRSGTCDLKFDCEFKFKFSSGWPLGLVPPPFFFCVAILGYHSCSCLFSANNSECMPSKSSSSLLVQ